MKVFAFATALLANLPFILTSAELTFSGVFSDNAVLQRGVLVPVWGWAKPNEKITVTFEKQSHATTAGEDGKWMVNLSPLTASHEGSALEAKSSVAGRQCKLHNVVVGDVWLCSGQSNMHFRMQSVDHAPKEIAAANHPHIRFFNVSHKFGRQPLQTVQGEWLAVSPATASQCSAVAYYFAKNIHQHAKVPIGMINSSVGGTRIESWMKSETVASCKLADALIDKWEKITDEEFVAIEANYRAFQEQRDRLHPLAVKEAKSKGAAIPPAPIQPKLRCHDCPSSLHCGMIAPLQPYSIRGAIWYQGESNAGHAAQYEVLLPAMIADWRQVWGKEMPFLFVQLAPHSSIHPSFREAQHRIWKNTPHTAMAVTTDVGNAENIHPPVKSPVGERLAIAARAMSYGEKIESSGPVFDAMKIDGNRIEVTFSHIGSGLQIKGDRLKGFVISDDKGKFFPANAKIEGNKVIVSSPKVIQPKGLRYNWAIMPDGNLFNCEGLPAAQFRSDASVEKTSGK